MTNQTTPTNTQPTSGVTPPVAPPVNPPQSIKFDEWLSSQDEAVKAAYEEHVTGLKNTVKATRDERDEFAKGLREAAAKLTKGSDAEKALTEMASKYEIAEKRANFYEEAIKPGIDCRNPKAAYALAASDNLFDRRGTPDWNAIKAIAPELFGRITPPGNAGAGTQTQPQSFDMNARIRAAAGRT